MLIIFAGEINNKVQNCLGYNKTNLSGLKADGF